MLGIVSVVTTVAAPNLRSFLVRGEVKSVVNELDSTLRLARSEAIRQNRPVTVCPSADGQGCNVNKPYSVGWIVKTGATTWTTGDRILADRMPLNQAFANASNSSNGAITFLANGLPSAGFMGLTISVGATDSALGKNLIVARTGRTRVASSPS